MASRLDGSVEDGEGFDDEAFWDGLLLVYLMLIHITDRKYR